jgi:hypothetical protein
MKRHPEGLYTVNKNKEEIQLTTVLDFSSWVNPMGVLLTK